MNRILGSDSRPSEHHSRKKCCCGFHSAKARKRYKAWRTGKDRRVLKDNP